MHPIHIRATTLNDAWHQAVFNTLDHGTSRIIEHGSYQGAKRLECDHVTIHITMPWVTPLVPKLNPGLNLPDPVDESYIAHYMPYLMTDHMGDNEQYTYGERIAPQIERVIESYRGHGYSNNQNILQVGKPSDNDLDDPPCLRHIDTVIKDGSLHFFPYFRSWDLFGGFPANMAGIELLKQHMADEIGVANGEMICSSKSLHLYDYVWDTCKIIRGKA